MCVHTAECCCIVLPPSCFGLAITCALYLAIEIAILGYPKSEWKNYHPQSRIRNTVD